MEKLTLTTEDGATIAANYFPAAGERYAILLHMMPATKDSWNDFASGLHELGIASIAIDFRGHGESDGGPAGYHEFDDAEHAKKMLDVRAAWMALVEKGAKAENTVVVGASIGANLAIDHLAEHETIPAAVALSPGLDYHGVKTDLNIEHLSANQKVLLVASDEDEYSALSVDKLHLLNASNTEKIEVQGMGHGTKMTDISRELRDKILKWIDDRI